MTWAAFIQALPEIIGLVKAILYRIESQAEDPNLNKRKVVKEKIDKIGKAIKENDEKSLNDAFNSL